MPFHRLIKEKACLQDSYSLYNKLAVHLSRVDVALEIVSARLGWRCERISGLPGTSYYLAFEYWVGGC